MKYVITVRDVNADGDSIRFNEVQDAVDAGLDMWLMTLEDITEFDSYEES